MLKAILSLLGWLQEVLFPRSECRYDVRAGDEVSFDLVPGSIGPSANTSDHEAASSSSSSQAGTSLKAAGAGEQPSSMSKFERLSRSRHHAVSISCVDS